MSCELAFLSSPTCCCCCCCCHPICSLLPHWGFMAKQAARYFVGAHLSDMGICWSPRKRLLKETGGGFISHWHADNKLEPGVKHTGGKSRVRWEDLEITLKAFRSIFGVFQDFFWIMSLFLCSSNLDKMKPSQKMILVPICSSVHPPLQ